MHTRVLLSHVATSLNVFTSMMTHTRVGTYEESMYAK